MNKKIRILIVNDYSEGGGAEKVFNQTFELLKNKNIIVKKYFGAGMHQKILLNDFHNLSEYIKKIKDRFYSFEYYKKFKEVLNDFQPDIVHLHNYNNELTPSILYSLREYRKECNKVVVFYTAHDYHLICPYSAFIHYSYFNNKVKYLNKPITGLNAILLKWDARGYHYSIFKTMQWLYCYSFKKLYKEIDHIICPSENLGKLIALKYKKIIISIIRNPILFTPRPYERKRNINPKNDISMVYIGRISKEKGLKEFLTTIEGINNIKFNITIIGIGPEYENLNKFSKSLRISKNIIFKGYISHDSLLNHIADYDALVLPSLWPENAPLVIVEAAFWNLRIITGNYGGMSEMANICGGEYLMNPLDSQSVVTAVTKCYLDIIKEKPLYKRNIYDLINIFNPDKYVEELIKLYRSS